MIDYRLPENRRDLFIEWMRWSIEEEDCDPSIYMAKYLFNRFELNIEQKLWICWLYGTTYYLPTSWVIHNEFPDFELVDLQRLDQWNTANYKRLRYQTDTKYNKGHLPAQFESYRKWIGSNSQRSMFHSLLRDNEERSYQSVSDAVQSNCHKFGRYTTWFYLQSLKHCVGMPIEPKGLLLSNAGSKSHRNGLCYILNREDLIDVVPPKATTDWMESEAKDILEAVRQKVSPEKKRNVDMFAMETCLCSVKKIFRKSRSRWLGYYLARQKQEIEVVESDGWNGICWRPFWDARKETLPSDKIERHSLTDVTENTFLKDGQIQMWNQKPDESSIMDMLV